jgi:hypothetical protein
MSRVTHPTSLAFGIALASALLLPASATAQNTSSPRRGSGAQEGQQGNSQERRRRQERRYNEAEQGRQHSDDQDESRHGQQEQGQQGQQGQHGQGHHGQGQHSDGQHDDGQHNDGQHNDGILNDGEFGNNEGGSRDDSHSLLHGVGVTDEQREELIAARDRHAARVATIRDSLAREHAPRAEPEGVASCWDRLPLEERRSLVGSDPQVRREQAAMVREVRQILTPRQRGHFDVNARQWARDREVRTSHLRRNAHC